MARRLHKTLVDYLVIAISPALIMALVGSLVFFLLEVFYRGNFHGRLQYIFALFVMGAVLIGRISIEEGRERAVLFAVPLAIVTLMAINKFVEFQGGLLGSLSIPINCGLIGIIWWSADKLTWDCTLIDESEEDSGEGLLESVGFDRADRSALDGKGDSPIFADTKMGTVPVSESPASHPASPSPRSWWQRFVERRRRPHAPGVWVVYFSLAALPLFGIGQLFMPAGDLSARQYAFQLLFVYTASGLGLLMSTSFLGLRRYLRQRGQEMPLGMVGLWLSIGTVLIAAVMMAAMLLPRPNAEYAVSELPFHIGSPDQKSSRYGTGRDGVKEDQPWSRGEKSDEEEARAQGPSDKSDKQASPDSKGSAKDEKAPASKDGEDSADQSDKSGKRDDDSSRGKKGREASGDSERRDSAKEGESEGRNAQKKGGESSGKGEVADKQPAEDRAERRPGSGQGSSSSAPLHAFQPLHVPLDAAALLVTLAKWLLYGLLGVLGIWWAWKNRDAIISAIANMGQWLADFWNRLFGGGRRRPGREADQVEAPRPPSRRFADFTDPFASGMADRYPPEELVRYTFEALEAWARDRGHPRPPEQTPHEFARSVGSQAQRLADDTVRLAELYCQVAYAPGTLRRKSLDCLSRCWQGMNEPEPIRPEASIKV